MRFPGICTTALILGTLGLAQNPSEVSGDYLEVRSNHVHGCYCEWSGEAVTGGREAILAWNITSGSYAGISLAGVKIVAVVVGQRTLSVGSTPRNSVVFFDEAATKEQRRAAQDLIRQHYTQLLGELLKTYEVPIGFYQDADIADVSAGEILHVALRKARLPEDALPGAVHWYDPFVPLKTPTLGFALGNRYQGQDFNIRWDISDSGTSGYFGRFLLTAR
jgi:hypothetical protein